VNDRLSSCAEKPNETKGHAQKRQRRAETKVQHRRLLAKGCGEAQGYLFGRPMSSADARALIASQDSADGKISSSA
jgi:predicted signal transduction protein with EAL and GGDEF domain